MTAVGAAKGRLGAGAALFTEAESSKEQSQEEYRECANIAANEDIMQLINNTDDIDYIHKMINNTNDANETLGTATLSQFLCLLSNMSSFCLLILVGSY